MNTSFFFNLQHIHNSWRMVWFWNRSNLCNILILITVTLLIVYYGIWISFSISSFLVRMKSWSLRCNPIRYKITWCEIQFYFFLVFILICELLMKNKWSSDRYQQWKLFGCFVVKLIDLKPVLPNKNFLLGFIQLPTKNFPLGFIQMNCTSNWNKRNFDVIQSN